MGRSRRLGRLSAVQGDGLVPSKAAESAGEKVTGGHAAEGPPFLGDGEDLSSGTRPSKRGNTPIPDHGREHTWPFLVRSRRPGRLRILEMWLFTVASPMYSASAISEFVAPVLTSFRTSRSRSVNSATGAKADGGDTVGGTTRFAISFAAIVGSSWWTPLFAARIAFARSAGGRSLRR
jgi:hypothetical protein